MTAFRILIVDDHAVVRRGVRALLESQDGWEVCGEADNGLEAIEKAAELKPDLVVLDVSLPGLNGLDATPQILKASPNTEVLALTMHHSEELVRQVLRSGAKGYVLKSDADHSLVEAIESVRQHKPFVTNAVTEFALDSYLRGNSGEMEVPKIPTTPRERQIIQLVAESRSSKEVAATLGISVKTVESHRTNIMRKLRLRSVSDLVRYAIRNGIVEP
ncbi:MAG: response regulator transcription factor [Gemmatimonadaceae bacterium]